MIGLKQNDFVTIAKSNNAQLRILCYMDNMPYYFLTFQDSDSNQYKLVTATNETRVFSSLDTVIKFFFKHFRVSHSSLSIPLIIDSAF